MIVRTKKYQLSTGKYSVWPKGVFKQQWSGNSNIHDLMLGFHS